MTLLTPKQMERIHEYVHDPRTSEREVTRENLTYMRDQLAKVLAHARELEAALVVAQSRKGLEDDQIEVALDAIEDDVSMGKVIDRILRRLWQLDTEQGIRIAKQAIGAVMRSAPLNRPAYSHTWVTARPLMFQLLIGRLLHDFGMKQDLHFRVYQGYSYTGEVMVQPTAAAHPADCQPGGRMPDRVEPMSVTVGQEHAYRAGPLTREGDHLDGALRQGLPARPAPAPDWETQIQHTIIPAQADAARMQRWEDDEDPGHP